MNFTSLAHINAIYWLASLREGEQGATRRVIEDVEPLCRAAGLAFEVFRPASAAELLTALDAIAAEVKAGMLPLIHLDARGSSETGVLIVASGEHVAWPTIADKLRAINARTGNNLCVVSGTCFSFDLVQAVDISQVAPFFLLLAPEEAITVGELEDALLGFYSDVIDRAELVGAAERWFGHRLRLFHCERMLAVVLARYMNNAAVGQQKDRRKEHLITQAERRGGEAGGSNLGAVQRML